jgi:hypothetical protein
MNQDGRHEWHPYMRRTYGRSTLRPLRYENANLWW